MALDFYNSKDRKEHMFALESKQLCALVEIISEFEKWTGIFFNEYGDFTLDRGSQQTLLKIIGNYIQKSDLNINKEKTVEILSFYSLLRYFYNRDIVLYAFGD